MSETQAEHQASSMRELFEPAKLALDRAPVLRGVFDRFAASCSEIVRPMCLPQSTFMLNAVSVGSTWDFIEEYENGLCAIYNSPEWEARVLIGFDRRFVFSFTEAIFGGDGTEAAYESDRPFSAVEVNTAKEMFDLAANNLVQLFEGIDKMSLAFERIETKLDFSSIGLPIPQRSSPRLLHRSTTAGARSSSSSRNPRCSRCGESLSGSARRNQLMPTPSGRSR